jgi:hypothetical protein
MEQKALFGTIAAIVAGGETLEEQRWILAGIIRAWFVETQSVGWGEETVMRVVADAMGWAGLQSRLIKAELAEDSEGTTHG